MTWWARFVGRRPLTVLIACLVVGVLAAGWGATLFDRLTNGGFEDPASDSSKIQDATVAHFGDTGADVILLYRATNGLATDPANAAKVTEALQALPRGTTKRIVPYTADTSGRLLGDDGRAGMVLVTLAGDDQEQKFETYRGIQHDLAVDGFELHVNGMYPVFDEINTLATDSVVRAEMIAIPVVFVLSIIIFGSVVAALMPTIVGVAAIIGSFALLRTISWFAEVNVFSVNIVTILGMGLAIDYALFVVTRFREELGKHPDGSRASAAHAVEVALRTAGRTVLFSGLTVAVSLAALLIFPQPFLNSMGYGGVAAVLVGMTATLTLLPAILVLLGRNINKGGIGAINRAQERAERQGGWAKLAETVMHRPWAFIVPIVIGLVVMAMPFFHVRWGAIDAAMLPHNSRSVIASEKLADWFDRPASTAEVLVTAEKATDQQSLGRYIADLKKVPGVVDVQPTQQSSPGQSPATALTVAWNDHPQTGASQGLVRALRDVPTPPGTTVLVGGQSAATVDMLSSVGDRLPLMAGLVAVAMFVLLFLAFGSLVIPLKALLMNVLSLGAAFGAVTWIFADGHLERLLGFTSPGYLDPTEPLLMVAILFGLSMDYEVFLLSRIKEEYDQTHDNRGSVAHGLQKTGRLITSAAALLCVVVLGFAASELIFLKMVGVGMLIAIVLDATIVRALLVPATMRLLGDWNWWSPPGLRWVAKKFSLGH